MLSCGIGDFILSSYSIRNSSGHEAVIIYTKPGIHINKIQKIDVLSREKDFEVTAVEVIKNYMIIICVYWDPNGDTDFLILS